MNKLQHLLLKLSEECIEVGHIASKCMQFGLLEVKRGEDKNNKQRLHAELNDLLAIVEMLNDEYDLGFKPNQAAIDVKKDKVKEFLDYSIKLGCVSTDAVPYEQWMSFSHYAPNAKSIKAGSYWDLFPRDDFAGNCVEFAWDTPNQRNRITIIKANRIFYSALIDSFNFIEDIAQAGCTLVLNQYSDCLIVYNFPIESKAYMLNLLTASPLLKDRTPGDQTGCFAMNALEFIKDQGIEKAREVVEGAPESATHFLYDLQYTHADYLKHVPDVSEFSFDLWDGQAWKPFLRNKKRISLSDLKKMVESVDLIGKYHSIDHAKNHYNNLRKAINQYEDKDIGYLANELEQAIADYEAVYCVESIIEKREFDFGLAHDDEYVKSGDSNE